MKRTRSVCGLISREENLSNYIESCKKPTQLSSISTIFSSLSRKLGMDWPLLSTRSKDFLTTRHLPLRHSRNLSILHPPRGKERYERCYLGSFQEGVQIFDGVRAWRTLQFWGSLRNRKHHLHCSGVLWKIAGKLTGWWAEVAKEESGGYNAGFAEGCCLSAWSRHLPPRY